MPIPFVQFLLPNGRRKHQEIERPSEIEEIATRFIESGGRYECEVLTTGDVSLSAVKEVNGEEGDVAIVICKLPYHPEKAPDVLGDHIDKLVRKSEAFIEVPA